MKTARPTADQRPGGVEFKKLNALTEYSSDVPKSMTMWLAGHLMSQKVG
jgi:hypothetical protein